MKANLAQVKERIKQRNKPGMPDLVAREVYEGFCQEAVAPWKTPMEKLLKETTRLLKDILKRALIQAFADLKKRAIFKHSKNYLDNFLEDQAQETVGSLRRLYSLHTLRPFTVNEVDFERLRAEELHVLEHLRHFMRWKAHTQAREERQYRSWLDMSDEEKAKELDIRKSQLRIIGQDRFKQEVEVFAYIKGYYRLASVRFADAICLDIYSGMLPKITQDLTTYLEKKLGVYGAHGEEVYIELMEEEDATARKRNLLKMEVKKFELALRTIQRLVVRPEQEVLDAEEEGGFTDVGEDVDDHDT
jgi:hypothetical protein